jgi:hypothetical protein
MATAYFAHGAGVNAIRTTKMRQCINIKTVPVDYIRWDNRPCFGDPMADVHVRADEPYEEPASLVARASQLLVSGGIVVSAVAHLTLGGIVLLASPRLLATVPENSMMVDIITPQEFAEASSADATQLAVEKVASPASAASAAGAKWEQMATVPPVPTPQQYGPPLESRLARPQRQSDPPPPEEPHSESATSPEQALPDPARIADLLNLSMQVANPDFDGPPSESAAKLSAGDIAAFKQRLMTCWIAPTGNSGAKPNVVVRVSLAPNGRLRAEPDVISISSASSVDGPALINGVKRALQRCQPYTVLPADKYQEWKLLDLSFSQDGIADVGSPQNGGKAGPKG